MVQMSSDYLLYDGECPFCSAYVRMHRLRAAGVDLQLLDARDHPDLVKEHALAGRDINDGMILSMNGVIHYGGDVMHMLSLMSGDAGWVNRMFAVVFSNKVAARSLYPILRFGRNTTLKLMGRRRIDV
jgi:predicted DCC family thiol-disulfide oxidoreductase YuxK